MCHIFLPSNSTSSYSPAGGQWSGRFLVGTGGREEAPALRSRLPGTAGNLDREEHAHAHLVYPTNKLLKGWQDSPSGKVLAMEA